MLLAVACVLVPATVEPAAAAPAAIELRATKLKVSARGIVRVPLNNPNSVPVEGNVRLYSTGVKLAGAPFALIANRATRIRLKLSRAARNRLRRRHKMYAKLEIVPKGGAPATRVAVKLVRG